MKIKTSKLTGPALDWAVAQCLITSEGYRGQGLLVHRIGYGQAMPEFSSEWVHGGPIIERERIDLEHYALPTEGWMAGIINKAQEHGATPLIAAMRCYVASKLGDTVDVPEELC